MFEWYQKNLKKYEKVIFGILLALIVVSFAASGVATEMEDVLAGDTRRTGELAIETPEFKLTMPEFENFVARWTNVSISFRPPTPIVNEFFMSKGMALYEGEDMFRLYVGLSPQARDSGVRRQLCADIAVLIGAAKQAGLRVTKKEVEERIKASFGPMGGFDFDRYKDLCDATGLKPEQWERTVEEFLLASKYMELLESGVSVATQDVFNEFLKSAVRSKAKYVFYNDPEFVHESRKRVSQRALAEFIEASRNRHGFRQEPKARLEYVKITFESLVAGMEEPKDAEIEEYYKANKVEFLRKVYGPELPPPEQLMLTGGGEEDHDHDGDGHPDHEPGEHDEDSEKDPKKEEERYRPLTDADVRKEIVGKLKNRKAAEKAGEVFERVRARIFELRMEGVQKPDLAALATEFQLGKPETTEPYESLGTNILDERLGVPQAGSARWEDFLKHDPLSAPALEVKTDKAHLIARLVDKTDAKPYLVTGHLREKALAEVARRDAGLIARELARKLNEEFQKRFQRALDEKMAANPGVRLSDEELTAIRMDTFTTLCADKKLTVKETNLVTRDEEIPDVPDDRPFMAELFNIEVRGDVRVAYGNSGQYVIQLVQRRPPKADTFETKRKRLEATALANKRSRFLREMVEEFKKQKDAKGEPLVKVAPGLWKDTE